MDFPRSNGKTKTRYKCFSTSGKINDDQILSRLMAQLPKDKDIFLAIDANAIVHRAYHAYPETLSNSEGLQLNAVYGFTSMLLSVLAEFDPKYIICAFDTDKPTFRHTDFPDYKAHRKPTDQSLIDQFPLVETVVEAFNIPILKREGFEADDVLGDLAKKAKEGKWRDYDIEMVIVSGDKDLLQLVGDNVHVCLPVGNFRNLLVYDREETFEKMGVYPEQVVDFKAIVGDPSDNIPGVKGVGVKGAANLLSKYKTADEVYKNLGEIGGRQAELLKEGVEQMEMSKELARIIDDVGIDVGLEECLMTDFDRSKVLSLFQRYEFRSLINKLPDQPNADLVEGGQIGLFGGDRKQEDVISEEGGGSKEPYELGKSNIPPGEYEKYLKGLSKERGVYIYYIPQEQFMSDGTDPYGKLLVGIVDKSGKIEVAELEVSRETIGVIHKGFMLDMRRETNFYNFPGFLEDLLVLGGEATLIEKKIFDIQLAAHLVSSGEKSKSFDALVYKYLGNEIEKITNIDQIYENFPLFITVTKRIKKEFNKLKLSQYARGKINVDVKPDVSNLFYNYEVSLSNVLAQMELRGVGIDIERAEKISKSLEKAVAKAQDEVFSAVGHEFNLNSPKQLAEVLYDEIDMPTGRGKSARTTREDRLKKLEGLHPSIRYILEYRELSKLLNTYVTPLKELIREDLSVNGDIKHFIHTDFDQMGTTSGRLSSSNPNMQNLPMKGDWASKVRSIFVPHDGYKYFSMDYSQIELRILADLSQDKVLIRDFKQGKDIHSTTAARILEKPLKDVTDRDRRLGKTINFGIVYGQTRFGLASMLDIKLDQAEGYIEGYFENYTGVRNYLDETAKKVREQGYVETLLGRRRYIGGLESVNERVQSAALREAINMPIQGTAADIIKMAMVDINKDIIAGSNDDLYMILQVHDELIFEIRENKVEKYSEKLKEKFENVVQFDVPLVVHSSEGDDLSMLK